MFLRMLYIFVAACIIGLGSAGCEDYVPEALQAEPPGPAPSTDGKSGAQEGQITKHVRGAFYSKLDDIIDRGALRVGVSPGFIPFVASGEDALAVRKLATGPLPTQPRDIVGFDIEIARAIADSLEVHLEVMTYNGVTPLLLAVKKGEVDMAISGLTRTLQRARYHFFSEPYFTSGIVVLVPKGLNYKKLSDLNRPEVRLLVKPATTAETFAKRRIPEAQIFKAKDESVMGRLFNQGQQVAIVDAVKAQSFSLGGSIKIPYGTLENKRYTDEHFSIALPRDDAWRSYVNIFIEDYKESGKLAKLTQLFEPWFGKAK